MDNVSKLNLLLGMISQLEKQRDCEKHAGYQNEAQKLNGKLIPLYQGKNILMSRIETKAQIKKMFSVGRSVSQCNR